MVSREILRQTATQRLTFRERLTFPAHEIFANELKLIQEMLAKLDYTPFFGDNNLARLQFLQNAAEYILANTVEKKGEVSFMKRFTEHVKRLRSAFNILNPAGELTADESKWTQCFMGICSFVQKMTATKHDATEMNRHVEKVVQQAIFSSGVEVLLNDKGKEENIFSDEFIHELDDVTIYADFANNNNLKSKLSTDLTYLIYKEGYPPQWDQEVFQKVLEQVQNYKDCE